MQASRRSTAGRSLKSQVVIYSRKDEAVDAKIDFGPRGPRPTCEDKDGRISGSMVPGRRVDSLSDRKKTMAERNLRVNKESLNIFGYSDR